MDSTRPPSSAFSKRLATLLFLASIGFTDAGCRNSRESAAPPRHARLSSAGRAERANARATPIYYDADGNLLGSGSEYMGFELPVGFEQTSAVGGEFVYRSRVVPYEKLGSYVERQIASGTPQMVGHAGLIYRRARVRGSTDPAAAMDIRVFTIPGAVQLSLRYQAPVTFPEGTTQVDREREVNRAFAREPE